MNVEPYDDREIETPRSPGLPVMTGTALVFGAMASFIIISSGGSAGATASTDPPAASSDWYCDWQYALGDSLAAVRGAASPVDAGGLSVCYGTRTSDGGLGSVLATVAKPSAVGTGDTFPTGITNVLDVMFDTALINSGSIMVQNPSSVPALAVGEYLFIRSYDRFDLSPSATYYQLRTSPGPASSMAGHPWHIGTNTTGYRFWYTGPSHPASDSTYNVDIQLNQCCTAAGRGEGKYRNSSPSVKAFDVIQREIRVHRFHADSARIDVVGLNAITGDTLYTSDDFTCVSATGGCISGDTLGVHALEVDDWSEFRHIETGMNSPDPMPTTLQHWYWGGMRMRVSATSTDWIGAVSASGDPN